MKGPVMRGNRRTGAIARMTARAKKYAGSRTVTVEENQTGTVSVRMTRAGSAK